jgi:hypothetical protein
MKFGLFRLSFLAILGVFISAGWPATPISTPPVVPLTPDADAYGYTSESLAYAWEEINGLAPITFSTPVGGVAGPFPLGFSFRFYENTYTTFYVNTGGMITFGAGVNAIDPYSLPNTVSPNNLIAPFWANMFLNSGHAYYKNDQASNPKRTIIEWDNVGDPADPLSFQAILYENGNIAFHYKNLPASLGQYAVGLEDADGVSGLTIQYNNPSGISELSGLLIRRPGPAARVKLTPILQGGFVSAGTAHYSATIKNTGEPGPDNYEITITNSLPGWQVSLADSATNQTLPDSNANLKPETGSIPSGGQKTISIDVRAPFNAQEGQVNSLTLTAVSTANPAYSFTATVTVFVPVQFVQIYVRGATPGVRLAQIWQTNYIDRKVNNIYTGTSMSTKAIDLYNYVVSWENTGGGSGHSYTDIQYNIFNSLTGASSLKVLTNGAQLVQQEPNLVSAAARNPAIAVAGDGKAAFAWRLLKRRPVAVGSKNPNLAPDDLEETNTNIFFNLLDEQNHNRLLDQDLNVTGDINWYGTTSNTVYLNPAVAVTADNHYVICWITSVASQLGTGSDTVFCSYYTYNAAQKRMDRIQGPVGISVETEPWLLRDISLTPLAGNQVLLSYMRLNNDTNEEHIQYTLRSSNGAQVLAPVEIPGAAGSDIRSLAFGLQGEGDPLVAWLDPLNRIGYVYLDAQNNYAVRPGYPQYFSNPDGRRVSSLSMTMELKGRALLSWLDGDDSEHLYLAVLDSQQNVVTPPVIFMDSNPGEQLVTSDYGLGNASYQGVYQLMLPLQRK